MKKILSPILFCLLSIILIPFIANAALVTCGNSGGAQCTIGDFFTMLGKIYDFIVKDIATPLAIIAITIGGIMMMISAGNPNLMATGKKIFWSAVIGLALVFCSWLIINTVLTMIGAKPLG